MLHDYELTVLEDARKVSKVQISMPAFRKSEINPEECAMRTCVNDKQISCIITN